jgi:hypothetical protein
MLKEAGAVPSGELFRAWRGVHGVPTAPPADCKPRSAPVPPSIDTLIGRDMEVERISIFLREALAQRHGKLLLVSGEPGIGKSRLLEAAAALARDAGALLLEACAYESESIRPFALWIDALRELGPDTAGAIFGAGDRRNRDRLFSALSDLVADRARA